MVIVIYIIAFIATFDKHHNSILICSVAFGALFGWLYGIRGGLAAVPFFILLNTAMLWHVSGKPYDILLTYNPLGISLDLLGAIMMGALKESVDELTALRGDLTLYVKEETKELNIRVQQLITTDENNRIRIGQDLHDGIGQLLTGMLLHSEALASQLKELKRPEAEMAERIREHCQSDLLLIRKLARSFLPNHLNHTGFEAAVHELIDYFEQSSSTQFRLQMRKGDIRLSRATSLHLYRIIQEAVCYLLEYARPKFIDIALSVSGKQSSISIRAQQPATPHQPEDQYISKVMQYRANAIQGILSTERTGGSEIQLTCAWPTEKEHE